MRGRYIHDGITHGGEDSWWQCLRKEVGEIVCCLDVGDAQTHVLDHLTYEEMSPLDVFGLRVVLGIVREVAGAGIVDAELDGRVAITHVELVEEAAEEHSLLSGERRPPLSRPRKMRARPTPASWNPKRWRPN